MENNSKQEQKAEGLRIINEMLDSNKDLINNIQELKKELLLSKIDIDALLRSNKKVQQGSIKIENFHKQEEESRRQFLESVPKGLEFTVDADTKSYLEKFKKSIVQTKYFILSVVAMLALSLIILLISGGMAIRWYSQSVKTKTEVRNEILSQLNKDDKTIVDKSYLDDLEENVDITNHWIKNNPKDSEKFLIYKAGYSAKNKK